MDFVEAVNQRSEPVHLHVVFVVVIGVVIIVIVIVIASFVVAFGFLIAVIVAVVFRCRLIVRCRRLSSLVVDRRPSFTIFVDCSHLLHIERRAQDCLRPVGSGGAAGKVASPGQLTQQQQQATAAVDPKAS